MKNKKLCVGITILFSIISILVNAQNQKKTDSLFKVLKTAKADTVCMKLYLNIGDFFEDNQSDSAIYYYQQAVALAEKKTTKLNAPHKDRNSIRIFILQAIAFRYIGICFNAQGQFDKSKEYYSKSIKIFEELSKQSSIPEIKQEIKKEMLINYNGLGSIFRNKGMYDLAIENYLKSLKIAEELNDKRGISSSYGNIGNIHRNMGTYDKAIEYYTKSLKIFEELKEKKGMASCYFSIGNVYISKGVYNSAKEYYLKALKVFEEMHEKVFMSRCYNNIGLVYKEQGRFEQAIEYYLKALKIIEELKDKSGIAAVYGNISSLHISLADSCKNMQLRVSYYNKAVDYGNKAFNLSKEINAIPLENQISGYLKKAYKSIGNPTKALEYADIFIATKDSMYKDEKTKSLVEMEKKYEYEKNQLQIEKLEKQKELDSETMARQKAEAKKQQMYFLLIAAVALAIAVIAVIIFRSLRITRSQKQMIEKQKILVDEKNLQLNQQNEEIRTQRDEIESQRDEITAQRDLVTSQKEHIEEIHQEVTDSINYAKRIQQAMLPDLKEILKSKTQIPNSKYQGGLELGTCNLELESFILFNPKDVVSGDFYWATTVNKFLIVTVADCTGHGVPGAFMSMLGISFLNEIVRKKEILQASLILDHLRISVIDALKQKGDSREQKDGMDIALVVINTQTLEMQFAGANNPLWIVRKLNVESYKVESEKNTENNFTNFKTLQTFELHELKGDKQPIGIQENMTPFTNQIIQIQKGDIIYLASDGYEDQFGGSNRKKFLAKNLKNLLTANSQQPMANQQQILETNIIEWKGAYEQIDDITILGIKIS